MQPAREFEQVEVRRLRPDDLDAVIELDARNTGRQRSEYYRIKLAQALADTGIQVSLAAEVLRGSPYAADKTLEDAWALAAEAASGKYAKERRELVDLLNKTHQQGSVAIR